MKIYLQTPITSLRRGGVLGHKALRICGEMNFETVEDLLKTPVSSIKQKYNCDDDVLLHLCSIHKAFKDSPEIKNIKQILALRKINDISKILLIQEYFDHAIFVSDENGSKSIENVESDSLCTVLESLLLSMKEEYGSPAYENFISTYPSIGHLIASIKENIDTFLMNVDGETSLDRIAVRNLGKSLLARALEKGGMSYGDTQIIRHALSYLAKWSDFYDALDIFHGFNQDTYKSLVSFRDDYLSGCSPYYSVTMSDYDPKYIAEELKYVYGPIKYVVRKRRYDWCEDYLRHFKDEFKHLALKSLSAITNDSSLRELVRLVNIDHPYLSDSEKEYVISNLKAGKGYPWLYMYICHFQNSDDRNSGIKRDACGLNVDKGCMTFKELGEKYGLQPERIRMIMRKPHVIYYPFRRSLMDYLNFSDDIIGENDSRVEELLKDNALGMTSTQLIDLLTSIYRNSETITLPNGKKYLLKGSFPDLNRFIGQYSKIDKYLSQSRNKAMSIDLGRYMFLGHSRHISSDDDYMRQASKVFEESFDQHPNFRVDGPLKYTILPNMVNRAEAIRQILQEKAEPMSGKEIMAEFQRLYPNETLPSLSAFKNYIQNTDSVVSKGRTGYYILESWTGHYTGTITDLLSEILSESKTPLTVEELTNKAVVQFPTTGNRSIEMLLKREVPNRFVAFEGGKYGSSQKNYPKKYKILA